ncbi:MAG: hypothetical protein QM482_10035 [Sulfurospirillum sp.]
MDINSVPQDNSSTYGDMKKAIYASSEEGKIKSVGSSGWDVEEVVTKQAIDELEESKIEALKEAREGKKSPLYYHMYEVRMDLNILAQSTGFFKWTIKRDFKPEVFEKITQKRLAVYCDVMGKSIEELNTLPKERDERV